MLELKMRVEELQTENEYQLRLKDMNYNEKIKELTEKFIQQIESLTTQNLVRASWLAKQISKSGREGCNSFTDTDTGGSFHKRYINIFLQKMSPYQRFSLLNNNI